MKLTIEGEPKEIAEFLRETETRLEILNQSSDEIAESVQRTVERILKSRTSV